jgi:pyridinium-3,5-biscarboxylic acid mononucleotide sulfurtransferase
MSASAWVQIGDARREIETIPWEEKLARLRARLAELPAAIVAYSGGVDSSLLLRVAHDVLGDRVLAVIGRSDSYAQRELELALEQAAGFGARVEIVTTGELADPNFRSNPTNRCYHCKNELYRQLEHVAARMGGAPILDGTIADDLGDWRPGRKAAGEHGVLSPLAELGFTKRDIRQAAAFFGLESRDKPASPCLASRIPYGTEITRENLKMVEEGEALLRALGFRELRVRHHGDMARVEVAVTEIPRLLDPETRERVVAGLRALGYRFVTIDLEGLRSGSLNRGVAGIAMGEPGTGSAKGSSEEEAASDTASQISRNLAARVGDITVAPHGGGGTEFDLR